MISLDDAVVARFESHGHHFELLVDPEKASEFTEAGDLNDILAAPQVYKDASKGKTASEEALKEAFGTTDFKEVATKILKKGTIQLTTEQRHKMQEEKRKQIVSVICRDAIDPRTNAPHPRQRVENAINEAKFHVDPFKPAQRQVDELLKKLIEVLPLKFAKARVQVHVPAKYTGKAYGYLHDFQRVREEWKNDGTLLVVVEIPAGLQSELYDRLNAITKGEVETKLLETI